MGHNFRDCLAKEFNPNRHLELIKGVLEHVVNIGFVNLNTSSSETIREKGM
mgnify:CR=1 FL=1